MGGVGGFKRTCKGPLLSSPTNSPRSTPTTLPMPRPYGSDRESPPYLMLDTRSLELSENVAKTPGGRTIADMKALAPGDAYSESTSAAFSHSVEK